MRFRLELPRQALVEMQAPSGFSRWWSDLADACTGLVAVWSADGRWVVLSGCHDDRSEVPEALLCELLALGQALGKPLP